jgi:hypothetical protein
MKNLIESIQGNNDLIQILLNIAEAQFVQEIAQVLSIQHEVDFPSKISSAERQKIINMVNTIYHNAQLYEYLQLQSQLLLV